MITVGYAWDKNDIHTQTFHVGAGRIREIVLNHFGNLDNLQFQADGHELEIVRDQFQNIPMTKNRVVRWNGQTAQFIIENINLI